MIKKILAFGGAGVALLAMAVPTFACTGFFCFSNTTSNDLSISSMTQATANTGGNTQLNLITVEKASDIDVLGNGYDSQNIVTGAAYADAKSLILANSDPCGCGETSCMFSKTTNRISVEGGALAAADTGLNAQQISTEVIKAHDVTVNPVGGSSSTISTGISSSVARSRILVNVQPIMWR